MIDETCDRLFRFSRYSESFYLAVLNSIADRRRELLSKAQRLGENRHHQTPRWIAKHEVTSGFQ